MQKIVTITVVKIWVSQEFPWKIGKRKAEEFYKNYFRDSYHAQAPIISVSNNQNCWKTFLKDDYGKIKSSTHQEDPLYREFKRKILVGMEPHELLGLSSIFIKGNVMNAFKKYSRKVRPDHNAIRRDEVSALFKRLCEARAHLTKK